MDTGLDENEAELGVLVLSVSLKVLADSDGLSVLVSRSPRRESMIQTFLINM